MIPLIGAVTLGCALSACASTPHISAREKHSVAGILQPSTGSSAPTRGKPTSTTTRPKPSSTPGGGVTPSASSTPGTTPKTSAPAVVKPSGPPPNVVGQTLASGEQQLQAAGYGTAAHPWGGSCSAANQIMQQVPPEQDNVQLYYCVSASPGG